MVYPNVMKIALIGLPQAGKKTLFTLLTGRGVPPGRKPGESLEAEAPVRDPRVDVLSGICKPKRTVYAANHFVLCPDVEAGAAARDWMDAARKCDLLCLVARAFESDGVYHPAGSVDAERDVENIRGELLLADMELIEKRIERLDKEAKSGRTAGQEKEAALLKTCMAALEEGRPLAELEVPEHDLAVIRSLRLLTLIPRMTVYNVSEDGLDRDVPADAVAVSCLIEQEIMGIADPAERQEFLEGVGLDSSGVDRVNAAAYSAQGLMSFYTVGPDECRAWTIRKGASAPAAGGKIHSDIERGFIRVEVVKFDDFVAAGSEQAAKDNGKVLSRGRDYVIEDGDICHFLFNV